MGLENEYKMKVELVSNHKRTLIGNEVVNFEMG